MGLVKRLSQALNLKSAMASKERPQPEQAIISEAVGDFTGKRTAIVLDDMISSAGTMYAIIEKLVRETEIKEIHVGVSHSLCLDIARERLLILHARYGLEHLVITDSIPQSDSFRALPFLRTRCLSGALARAIGRIHHGQPVTEPSSPDQAAE